MIVLVIVVRRWSEGLKYGSKMTNDYHSWIQGDGTQGVCIALLLSYLVYRKNIRLLL